MPEPLPQDYLEIIKEIQEKMDTLEEALGLVNSASKHMYSIEILVKEVKNKLEYLEDRIGHLVETLSKYFKITETRISVLEKRLQQIEMKESLVQQVYDTHNFKN